MDKRVHVVFMLKSKASKTKMKTSSQLFITLKLVTLYMLCLNICGQVGGIEINIPALINRISTNVCTLTRQYKVGVFEEKLTWFQAFKACQAEGYRSLDRAGPLWQRRILMRQYLQTLDNFTTGIYWTDLFRPEINSNQWYSFRQNRCASFSAPNMTYNADEHCGYVIVNSSEPLKDMIQLAPENCYAKHSYACIKNTADLEFDTFSGFEVETIPNTMYMEQFSSMTYDDCMIECGDYEACTSFVYDFSNSSCTQYLPHPYYNEGALELVRTAVNVTFAKKIGCVVARYGDSDLNKTVVDETFSLPFPNCSTAVGPVSTTATTTNLPLTTSTIANITQPLTTVTTIPNSTTTTTTASTAAVAITSSPITTTVNPTTAATTTSVPITTTAAPTTSAPKTTTAVPKTSTTTLPLTQIIVPIITTTNAAPTSATPVATTTKTTTTTAQSATSNTSIASSSAKSGMSTSKSSAGTCACNYCNAVNITDEELNEIIEDLVRKLRVESNTTSSYRRTKTSAEDHRPEAKAIGAIGLFVTIAMLCIPILLDLSTIKQSYETHQQKGKVKPRESPNTKMKT